jgi:hypothetical protein
MLRRSKTPGGSLVHHLMVPRKPDGGAIAVACCRL